MITFLRPSFDLLEDNIKAALAAFDKNEMTDEELDTVLALYIAITKLLRAFGTKYAIIVEHTEARQQILERMKHAREHL